MDWNTPLPQDPEDRQFILEKRIQVIGDNIRCLTCKGQSIQDSPADIAVEMRNFIRSWVYNQRSKNEIYRGLRARWGEKILMDQIQDSELDTSLFEYSHSIFHNPIVQQITLFGLPSLLLSSIVLGFAFLSRKAHLNFGFREVHRDFHSFHPHSHSPNFIRLYSLPKLPKESPTYFV